MNWLVEPLRYEFMRDALGVGVLVALVCAVLSCYLVLKGWALLGDAVSHAVLPGIVLAYLLGLPLALGAFATGLFCAVAAGHVRARSRIKEDTALGIVFTGLFALGLVLFTKAESELDLHYVLFGHILGITPEQTLRTTLGAGAVLLAVWLLRRELLWHCFDAPHARSLGRPAAFMHYLLLSLLVLATVVSMQAVGVILVVAMLITPGCVGYLLTDRFGRMLGLAAASAVLAVVAGIYASYHLDASTAACIVLAQAGQFALAFVAAPKHGLLAQRRRRAAGPAE